MIWVKEAAAMETKNIILKLRMQKGLSQDELAEKIMVTRQAVSLSLIHICGYICRTKEEWKQCECYKSGTEIPK